MKTRGVVIGNFIDKRGLSLAPPELPSSNPDKIYAPCSIRKWVHHILAELTLANKECPQGEISTLLLWSLVLNELLGKI